MHIDLLHRSPDLLQAWAQSQPWAERMRGTEQDQQWHAEGDVWTHTTIVCSRLVDLPEWQRLPAAERSLLYLAALFHDAGKPATTEQRRDRTLSPNHAPSGRRLVRQILIHESINYRYRERIGSLVRWHTTPPTITRRAHPRRTVIDTSWRTESNLLYLLARADGLGRQSIERDQFLERVDRYRELCLDLNCFTQPYPFANDLAKFLWFRSALPDPAARPEENYACQLTMLCGLPGAGKDHWYRQNASNLPMISLDHIRKELGIGWTDDQGRVLRVAEERFRAFLAAGESFVYNATNIDRAMRRKWIRLARHGNARIRIIYIEPPLDTILRQNREREAVVDEGVIDQYVEKLEVPDQTEAHEVVWT